jgi:drug/metabolite transporter (DMT)-like permease
MSRPLSRSVATLIGFVAILLWGMLALLTVGVGPMPPFQLTAIVFLIGGLMGAATWLWRPQGIAALRQPWPVWALGIGGLFGYHALYFLALRLAPPAETSLISYMWPLLIVVFSALLPTERLKSHHVAGTLIGLGGLLVLAFGRGDLAFRAEHLPGYLCSAACAVIWAAYSVASRRFGDVPTDVVTGFCLVTAVLSAICHLAVETTVWPATLSNWLSILLLGLGPIGLAFFTWDIGMKKGDIRTLGAASYAAPVLSTLILVAAGFAPATWPLFVAAGLIAAGGLYAAKDNFSRAKTPSAPA